MLEHDLQVRQARAQRDQHGLDEYGFAVEDIDLRIGDLAMDQQRHADFRHPLQHASDLQDIGDTEMGIGGGPRGIELGRDPGTRLIPGLDRVGIGIVGQVQRHQRLEPGTCRQGSQDAGAIGVGGLGCGDGRRQVRHDDSAGELPRGITRDRLQHRAIAEMDMPVVGSAQGDLIGHGRPMRGEEVSG